ncbi:MAG: DMT family transporter [Bacteroidetes bacterium]|nr:DMT family transporter [Bacteroidota bacterium]
MPRLSPAVQYMLCSTLLFSVMNLTVKWLPHIPAMELIVFRSLITALMSWVQLRRLQISPWGVNHKLLILRGLFGSVGLWAYFNTLQHMPLASAVTLQYLAPIFTVIIAYFLLQERLGVWRILCFLVAFAGVVLLRVDDIRIQTEYLVIGVVGAMAGGFAYNFVRMLRATDHPLVVVFYFPLVTLPFALPIAIPQWVMPVGWEWALVVAMGILTQLAQLYLTRAFQAGTAGTVSIVMYVGALFALTYGYLFFSETFSLISLAGMCLVVLGVLLNILFAHTQRR